MNSEFFNLNYDKIICFCHWRLNQRICLSLNSTTVKYFEYWLLGVEICMWSSTTSRWNDLRNSKNFRWTAWSSLKNQLWAPKNLLSIPKIKKGVWLEFLLTNIEDKGCAKRFLWHTQVFLPALALQNGFIPVKVWGCLFYKFSWITPDEWWGNNPAARWTGILPKGNSCLDEPMGIEIKWSSSF